MVKIGKPAQPVAWAAQRRFAYGCLACYAAIWSASSIHPWYPRDWLLENLLVATSLPLLIWLQRSKPWSRPTNAALLLFFTLHSIGAHYTYAQVPYLRWIASLGDWVDPYLSGQPRNQYDRFVHFMYGVLVLPAIRAVNGRLDVSPGVREFHCVEFVVATSAVYELLEWAAVLVAAPELGAAYLGTQGDAWDAHKDMLLASLGACANSVALMVCRRWRHSHG